jgi:hypothetical protein
MGGHGIPDIAFRKFRIAHHQLTGGKNFRVYKLPDYPPVAAFVGPEVKFPGLLLREDLSLIAIVGGSAEAVIFGRIVGVTTGKGELPAAHSGIKAVLVIQGMIRAIDPHCSRAPDIDYPQLPAFEEIVDSEYLPVGLQLQGLSGRHDPANNDAVNMTVNHFGTAGDKKILNKKLPAQTFGIEILAMLRMNGMSYFHVVSVLSIPLYETLFRRIVS